MCAFLVFATCDVTPEHWAKFREAKLFNPEAEFVLVYSRSQADFTTTDTLSEQVNTEFKNATIADIYAHMETILDDDNGVPKRLYNTAFMVFDEKSEGDGKVVVMSRIWSHIQFDTGFDRNKWRMHRVPFEIAHDGWFLIASHLGF